MSRSESGMTIIEIVVAIGISVAIAAGVATVMSNFQTAAKHSEIVSEAEAEIREFQTDFQRLWTLRVRPLQLLPLQACGAPGCKSLKMPISRRSGTDPLQYTSSCQPYTGNAATILAAAKYQAGSATPSCLPCNAGQRPVTVIASKLRPADAKTYPHNGSGGQPLRTAGILGMAVCFSQVGGGQTPTNVEITATFLDTSGKGLQSLQKTMTLPYDNFAGINTLPTH